ncbi:MAG TPA: hypothetical protein VF590_27025 [Isosphaeraceae bacterium]
MPVADIGGRRLRVRELGTEVGLSILSHAVAALGGSGPGVAAALAGATSVEFEYREVTEDAVDTQALVQFLGTVAINPGAGTAAQLLEEDVVCVVTRTLKARTLAVDARDQSGRSLAVDASHIHPLVGGRVQVAGGDEAAATVSFRGETPLVFGFQAVQLVYRRGRARPRDARATDLGRRRCR